MHKKDVCIIVAAQGISKKVITRFRESVAASKPKCICDVMIKCGREKKFYKTRIINDCLRKTLPKYKVIIQTDIDLLVPPKLIDKTFNMAMGQPSNCFHHFLRYVNPEEIKGKRYKDFPWHDWVHLKADFCSGCWNGMTGEAWKKSGGLNEDMFAWGAEDTEFYNRSKRKGIRWINCKDFALVHINHPRRQKKRAKENFEVGRLYSDQTNWLTGDIVRKSPG